MMMRRTLLPMLLVTASTLAHAQGQDLLAIYDLALRYDPQYQGAGASNLASQELRPQARAALLPDVGASASLTHNEVDINEGVFPGKAGYNARGFDISITQPIYRRDLWVQLEQADSLIRAADLEYAFARQDLMLRVGRRYFAVLAAQDQLSFARSTLEAFEQQLRQAQQRFDVGIIAITDVDEAQAGFDQAKSDIIVAETLVDNAYEALREITGSYHQNLTELGPGMPLVVPAPEDIDEWTETALRQNLQLRASLANADTAWKEIDRVRAGHLPTLDLVGTHSQRRDDGSIGLTSTPSRRLDTTIGLRLNVPIYQGGLVVSRTRESRALYQGALDEVERARRSTQRQARDAYLGVVSGISRVRALEASVRSSESQVKATTAAFQVGTRTSVDVLNAERDLFDARRELAAQRYQYILSILDLKQAAGTLSEADLDQVNGWLR
jgi:outer membrane protein